MADVEVMLEQIKYLLDCSDAVKDVVKYKVARQLERIATELEEDTCRHSLGVPPGETVKELLGVKELTEAELAKLTKVPLQYVLDVIRGRAGITESFADSLEHVFGVSSYFWLNLQAIWEKERGLKLESCLVCGKGVATLSSMYSMGKRWSRVECPVVQGGCGASTCWSSSDLEAVNGWNEWSKKYKSGSITCL